VVLFARTMGGALGVGAMGALLASRLRDTLEPSVVQGLLDPHGREAVLSIPGVIEALGSALQPLFWVTAACAALSLLVVLAYPRDSVSAPL
jgi:hypothetical protein